MSKEEIIERVEQYMAVEEPIDVKVEVLHDQVRPEGEFWRVPVRTDYAMPRRFRYYEKITDVEIRLQDEDNIKVVLIPA